MSIAKLYAARVGKRAITILNVPHDIRDDVMELLSSSDRARCERALESATSIKGRPTKEQLLEQAQMIGVSVPEGATNAEIAELIRGA